QTEQWLNSSHRVSGPGTEHGRCSVRHLNTCNENPFIQNRLNLPSFDYPIPTMSSVITVNLCMTYAVICGLGEFGHKCL
ncbi:hypothetical protein J6590_100233, partial [Homalodisca vitripennis]